MLRYSLVMLVGLAAPSFSVAATWADAMFDTLTRDFGSVPRGVLLSHPFRLTNNTGSPVTIRKIRVSCGCTTARALRTELAPGQSTAILVQMDTRLFQRDKNVTIYVEFSRPRVEEVRLWVQASSRDDIVVAPDTLAFGLIKKGSSPAAAVSVSFMGDNKWKITGVASESNYVRPTLRRVAGSSPEVTYQLTATLRPDIPVGKWYTDLWVLTDNPSSPRVRVPLTVEVQSALNASPAGVLLGQVRLGTVNERKVIVHASQPFRILAVQGTDAVWTVRESSKGTKPVHVLTVTFIPRAPGDLGRTIRVVTDLKEDNILDIPARAVVVR